MYPGLGAGPITTWRLRHSIEDAGIVPVDWGFGLNREPIQSSPFAMTAYAIRVMNTYLPESMAKERAERITRALVWVKATPAVNNEDRTFKLLALAWGGAPHTRAQRRNSLRSTGPA